MPQSQPAPAVDVFGSRAQVVRLRLGDRGVRRELHRGLERMNDDFRRRLEAFALPEDDDDGARVRVPEEVP